LLYRARSLVPMEGVSSRVVRGLFVTALVLMVGMVSGQTSPLGLAAIYALLLSPFVLFDLALVDALPLQMVRFFSRLGQQSYSLFFVHLFLLKCWVVVTKVMALELSIPAAIGMNLLIALPLSWLVSEVALDPIDRWMAGRCGRGISRIFE
jgi:peptidoglycan/LPS O-acetylase OafA/YrhL